MTTNEKSTTEVQNKTFDASEFLKTLPRLPGVYRYFDAQGNLLYVGKARDLKRRVSSYFQKTLAPRTQMMVDLIARAEITVVNSEAEALILESNLIKSQSPRFNILFRDDKSYPYLKFSAGDFPRLSYFRGALDKKQTFFGPFPNATAAKEALSVVQKVFQVRVCENSVFNNRSRPCLLHQISRCSGPCCNCVTKEEYAESVRLSKEFLEIQKKLQQKMEKLAEALEFEKAAAVRDQLAAISNVTQMQTMTATPDFNVDIIAAAIEGGQICVNLAMVRGGRHLGDRSIFPKFSKDTELPSVDEVVEAFVAQHYLEMDVPPVVLANVEDNSETISELLNSLAQRTVYFARKPRGIRKKWLDLAAMNA